jgi:hypothetical protein
MSQALQAPELKWMIQGDFSLAQVRIRSMVFIALPPKQHEQ